MLDCPSRFRNLPTKAESAQHVVHGVLSLDLGGLERLVLELIKLGRRRNQRVSVICVEREGVLAKQAQELGAAVFCLAKPPGRSQATIQSAARLLRSLNPDILHTHQIGALWYLGQAAQQAGARCVVHTEHSDHVTQATTWSARLRARWLWWRSGQFAQRFCCVSHDIAQSAQRWGTVPPQKVAVVPNGIDVERIEGQIQQRSELCNRLGIPSNSFIVGTVGRLVEVKQHWLLLWALPQLRKSLGDVRLLLIGEGPERANLEQLATQLGVEQYVVFAGYHAEPFAYAAAMDVFAMTSRHEGLPLALLEAWAAGLPAVCSAVGGMEKIVQHEVNGLLFPAGNRQALVSSLGQVLSCPSTAKRLGEQGQRTVREHFSSDRMAREYALQYQLGGGK
jgi:glycosyltransferase involved in cell wall biosynthesis